MSLNNTLPPCNFYLLKPSAIVTPYPSRPVTFRGPFVGELKNICARYPPPPHGPEIIRPCQQYAVFRLRVKNFAGPSTIFDSVTRLSENTSTRCYATLMRQTHLHMTRNARLRSRRPRSKAVAPDTIVSSYF